jgi:hypothetical protein
MTRYETGEQFVVVDIQRQPGHAGPFGPVNRRQELVINRLNDQALVLVLQIVPDCGEQERGGGESLLTIDNLKRGLASRDGDERPEEVRAILVDGLREILE